MSVNTHMNYDDYRAVTIIGNTIRVDEIQDASSIEEVISRVENNDTIDIRRTVMFGPSTVTEFINKYLVGNHIVVTGEGKDIFDKMFISVANEDN